MKSVGFIFSLLLFTCSISYGELAMSKFSVDGKIKLQLLVNGSIINEKPKPSILIKSPAGLQNVTFKIYDVCGNLVDECYENLFIKSGLISDFQLIIDDCGISHLKLLNESFMYVERLRKPDRFYNDPKIALRNNVQSLPDSNT